MNKDLLTFIKELSLNDKKSLMGKACKITEENGELSRAILPFESADGTHHRFVEKNKILEECMDIILAAISIPYSLGYTNEDIEDMILKKATKWQGIQAKEGRMKFPVPFELHVTINQPDDIEAFKEDCKAINVKPIILDLEHDFETVMTDVMTSSVIVGTNTDAYNKVNEIGEYLTGKGYNVVRLKMETVPYHPMAPSILDVNPVMPEGCYFESHIGVLITSDRKEALSNLAKEYGAHMSRNYFKKNIDGSFVNMLTLRREDTYEEFLEILTSMKQDLTRDGFTFEKEVVEFALWDTKISHDSKWIK
jgi:hypothetical protein